MLMGRGIDGKYQHCDIEDDVPCRECKVERSREKLLARKEGSRVSLPHIPSFMLKRNSRHRHHFGTESSEAASPRASHPGRAGTAALVFGADGGSAHIRCAWNSPAHSDRKVLRFPFDEFPQEPKGGAIIHREGCHQKGRSIHSTGCCTRSTTWSSAGSLEKGWPTPSAKSPPAALRWGHPASTFSMVRRVDTMAQASFFLRRGEGVLVMGRLDLNKKITAERLSEKLVWFNNI
jgi:hypothetical protein